MKRTKNAEGYILVKTDQGWILEHRLVSEQKLGRALLPGEVVHHVNGVKDDNRPENLEVTTSRDHIELHRDELTEAATARLADRRERRAALRARQAAEQAL